MKNLGYFALGFCFFVVLGAGLLRNDLNGRAVQGIAPSSFAIYSSTKADYSLNTAGLLAFKVKPSAAINVQINGSGAKYPVAADAEYTQIVGQGVTSTTFDIISSATKTKLYLQVQ